MAQEKLWPHEDNQVVREIIPGGNESREYLLYLNPASARIAQRLENSRFVPKILARLMDDGVPVDASLVGSAPAEETAEPAFLHETIRKWERQTSAQEVSHAA